MRISCALKTLKKCASWLVAQEEKTPFSESEFIPFLDIFYVLSRKFRNSDLPLINCHGSELRVRNPNCFRNLPKRVSENLPKTEYFGRTEKVPKGVRFQFNLFQLPGYSVTIGAKNIDARRK